MDSVIKVKNLSVSYDENIALENVNLEVKKGEYLGIIGPNGGGKTTLFNSILGLVEPSQGEIEILGGNAKEMRSHIGFVPQIAQFDRKFPISVVEAVMTGGLKNGLHPFFRYKKSDRENAMKKLELVGINDLALRQISQLSGGEFQRMLIARALAAEPEILMLDEPVASVDPVSREKIYKVLLDLNNAGLTIVMVTHDTLAISSSISSLACLSRTLVYHGEPKINEEVMGAMYGCPVDLVAHGVPHRVLGEHDHGEGGHCCD